MEREGGRAVDDHGRWECIVAAVAAAVFLAVIHLYIVVVAGTMVLKRPRLSLNGYRQGGSVTESALLVYTVVPARILHTMAVHFAVVAAVHDRPPRSWYRRWGECWHLRQLGGAASQHRTGASAAAGVARSAQLKSQATCG